MSNMPSANDSFDDVASMLDETKDTATSWLLNRSRPPVAPAAIAIPEMSIPEHGNPANAGVAAFLD